MVLLMLMYLQVHYFVYFVEKNKQNITKHSWVGIRVDRRVLASNE